MSREIDVKYDDGSWHLWRCDAPSKEEEEANNRKHERWLHIEAIIGSPIIPRTKEDLDRRMKRISLSDEERQEIYRRWNIIEHGKVRDPKPHYPPVVVAICVIVTIILFIWGFCR